ncbi:MAG: hypothetical protein M1834_001635 [Cirrosporium novae-zelandiae]|nr:MAG: hypothetical protein M1834_004152 [Cirrosporium novae-zelandiae]KAI9735619.1 MAG: hypothetical protein M1834_001635 [Cirrosporium novae-zelandiae]
MIDSKRLGKPIDTWKAHYQKLQEEIDRDGVPTNRLVEPGCTSIRYQTPVVHSACWRVVTKFMGTSKFDSAWLERLWACLLDLQEFLVKTPFEYEPDRLDSGLDDIPENLDEIYRSMSATTDESMFKRLPVELIQYIYMNLDRYEDVFSLQQITKYEPDGRVWLSLGRKYRACEPAFAQGSKQQVAQRIKYALMNLHNKPAGQFPHTRNYEVVWNNIMLVTAKMETISEGEEYEHSWPLHNSILVSTKNTLRLSKSLPLNNLSSLNFHFSHLFDRRYLCGISIEDQFVGYQGDSIKSLCVNSFSGLRLAFDSEFDSEGFLGVQARDRSEWMLPWFGNTNGPNHTLAFGQLQWPSPEERANLIISLDAFKIIGIAYRQDKADLLQIRPWVWRSRFPSTDLIPMVLIDCSPHDLIFPYDFAEIRISQCISFSALFELGSWAIVGIELVSNDGTFRIGSGAGYAVKLSAECDKDETFTAMVIGKSSLNPGIVVKLFTNLGRSFCFGNESETHWCTRINPAGFFGSSKTTGMPVLSAFGIFHSKDDEKSYLFQKISPTKHSVAWQKSKIQPHKSLEPHSVIISRASLDSVSKITLYHHPIRQKDLCGMKISYKYSGPVILGQMGVVHPSIIQPVGEAIEQISVHYAVAFDSSYCIRGLEFSYGSCNVQVGSCNHSRITESLNTAVQPTLVWAFSSSCSYLALSEEHLG